MSEPKYCIFSGLPFEQSLTPELSRRAWNHYVQLVPEATRAEIDRLVSDTDSKRTRVYPSRAVSLELSAPEAKLKFSLALQSSVPMLTAPQLIGKMDDVYRLAQLPRNKPPVSFKEALPLKLAVNSIFDRLAEAKGDKSHPGINECAFVRYDNVLQIVGTQVVEHLREWRIAHGLIVGDALGDPRFAPRRCMVANEVTRFDELQMLYRLAWLTHHGEAKVFNSVAVGDLRDLDALETAWSEADASFMELKPFNMSSQAQAAASFGGSPSRSGEGVSSLAGAPTRSEKVSRSSERASDSDSGIKCSQLAFFLFGAIAAAATCWLLSLFKVFPFEGGAKEEVPARTLGSDRESAKPDAVTVSVASVQPSNPLPPVPRGAPLRTEPVAATGKPDAANVQMVGWCGVTAPLSFDGKEGDMVECKGGRVGECPPLRNVVDPLKRVDNGKNSYERCTGRFTVVKLAFVGDHREAPDICKSLHWDLSWRRSDGIVVGGECASDSASLKVSDDTFVALKKALPGLWLGVKRE